MRRLLPIVVLAFAAGLPGQSLDESFAAGVAALNAQDWAAARKNLTPVVEKRPKDGRALLGLAEACRRLGLEAEAEGYAEAVAELAPEQPLYFRGLSIYHENAGHGDRAAQYEAFYLRSFPDDTASFGRAAALHLAAGRNQAAVEFARSGLERDRSAPLYDLLGKAQAALGDDEAAERSLREAVRLAPYDEEYRYNLGYLHLRAQRFEQAIEAFEEARKVFDKSARLTLGSGVAQYGLRRFGDALEAFLRAAEMAPGAPQPHYFLGRMLEHAGDRIGEVVERQRVFAESFPDSYLGPFLLGQALLASLPPEGGDEQAAEAERLLGRSTELRGDFWESHFERGVALERLRRFDEAATALERAVELNSDSSKPRYRLARVYARLGRTGDAAREREAHQRLVEAERAAMKGGMAGALETPLIE